jgi:ribonuclease Z
VVAANRIFLILLFAPLFACAKTPPDTCLEVILTGTQGGPPAVNGLAGSGTLVRYGRLENQCNDVLMQFDVGRGTTGRLSQLNLSPNDLDAVFLTHLHSDHTEGLIGLMQLRWHFLGDPLDIACTADAKAGDRTMSCDAFLQNIAEPFVRAGEIAQRVAENNKRHADGPKGLVRFIPVPVKQTTAVKIWESGDVSVSAVSTTHIAGSLAYRVDTPVGSVVIGGDAGNSKQQPPRDSSTSESVEALARDADVLVHSVMHPAFAPGSGSTFSASNYYRQSSASDLGALAERAGVKHLVFTHLIPALDTPAHGPFEVPGGPLDASDFESAARASGFKGEVHVGEDLLTVRIPEDSLH